MRTHALEFLVGSALLAACGSQPVKAPPGPAQPMPVDAGLVVDAATSAADVAPDAQEYEATAAPDERPYRKLVLPPPLVLAAPTPASSRCLAPQREASVRTYEQRRQLAALDAAIRARGWTPLAVHAMPPADAGKGGFVRGASDERLLPVASESGCMPEPPVVAMNAQHEVFRVAWTLTARQTRTVKFCTDSCYGGCGMPQQAMFGAEVPADAKLDLSKSQKLDVHLDVTVEVGYVQPSDCRMP